MVNQTKRGKLTRVLQYVNNNAEEIILALSEEENVDNKYSTTFVNSLDAKIKNDTKNIVKMWRWLIDDLGVNTPSAFTDAQVDAIDNHIRTQ